MENSYHKIINSLPLSSYCIDDKLNMLYINSSGLKNINASLSEIKGQSITVYFPDIFLCFEKEGENIKSIFVDKLGARHEVLLKFSLIDDNDLYGILYVVEYSQLKQKTIDKQKFNEIILDNIPADIAVFDKNHNYLYINPSGIRDVETRKWMIGKNDFDYCDFKGLDKTLAQNRRDIFNKVIQTKQLIEWIDEYHRDDTDIYVLRRFYPVFIDDIFYYVIGYGIDVTELKRTQDAVISIEDRNQKILNSALDAVIIINPDGKITFWNAKAEFVFGWKSEEVLGKKMWDIIIPERYRKMHEEGMKKHIEGYASEVANKIIEFPALNKNNEEFPIEFSILPIYDKGRIINYCSFIRNITLRKKKEEQVVTQNKMLQNKNSELEQFTYITSHDLQEPLLTLTSFSQLLIDEYSDDLNDEARLYIEFINKSANRMRALVTGLMEYARIGKRDDIKEVDCNLVIDDVLNDLSVKIDITKAKITVENLPIIRGYETYIRLLFQNLISNAIKFNRENVSPKVKIKCSENEKEWKFTVQDNGIGIDEKHIDQIFVIFKRLNNDGAYSGYGIGLAHCKKITDIHHGEIYVKSKLGSGSTFSFTISKKI